MVPVLAMPMRYAMIAVPALIIFYFRAFLQIGELDLVRNDVLKDGHPSINKDLNLKK